MGKLDRLAAERGHKSPLKASTRRTVTYEGAPAAELKAKTALFTLAATNMVAEDTFYEQAKARDSRFVDLVRKVAVKDPEWIFRFAPYLRGTLNMRSAAIVLAVETVRAWRKAGTELPAGVTVRRLVDSVLQRADEPGEFIAYWGSKTLPGGVQRGLQDAVRRLYTERAVIKWDGHGKAWRLGDVVELVHPAPGGPWQDDVFKYLLDRRHHQDARASDEWTSTLAAYDRLRAMPAADQRAYLLSDPSRIPTAGITWEHLAGLGPMDKAAWEAVIPNMGYMALLRNLRNFDEAGVSDGVAAGVAARLSDPEQVARSRQLPFRFLSAYQTAPSLRWGYALEKALDACIANVPALPGRTLVLIDTSGSMGGTLSARSQVTRARAAAVLGFALAYRTEAVTLIGYADGAFEFGWDKAKGMIRQIDEFCSLLGRVGWGTNAAAATRNTFKGHDRVVNVTDDQSYDGDPGQQIPATTPLFTFDVGGYGRTPTVDTGQGHRYRLGGLSDASFTLMTVLERGGNADWPF